METKLGVGVRTAAALWYGPARREFRRAVRPLVQRDEHIRLGPLRGTWYPHDLAGRLGVYEMDMQRLMVREIEAGMTVFDLGANYGFFSLLAGRLVGPTGTVVAAEPMPLLVDGIRRLLTNGPPWVHVVEAAVSAEVGEASIYAGATDATASLSARAGQTTTTVQTTTIDQLAAEHGMPDFIKMDIEGGEDDALLGADETLKHRPKLALEIHSQPRDQRIGPMLRSRGYRLVEAAPRRPDRPYPVHQFLTAD